jgi:hypothetical protein
MKVLRYSDELAGRWDDFVRASKNGTFLFLRGYMDYHRDRFPDHSLIFVADSGAWVAVFPATAAEQVLSSHSGLTYGGFVTDEKTTTPLILQCFELLRAYCTEQGFGRVIYKTIPHIYHRLPAEEDQYGLFRSGAKLHRRDVLSAICRPGRAPTQERRRRGHKKALQAGARVVRTSDFEAYWRVLEATLQARHDSRPVHTHAEIALLASRFPENIQLHAAFIDSELVAGIVMFVSEQVAHAQYIAAGDRGREVAALDLLGEQLISETFASHRCFDFGISNEQNGMYLNNGLLEQKEGFGARAVVHDHYTLEIGAGG